MWSVRFRQIVSWLYTQADSQGQGALPHLSLDNKKDGLELESENAQLRDSNTIFPSPDAKHIRKLISHQILACSHVLALCDVRRLDFVTKAMSTAKATSAWRPSAPLHPSARSTWPSWRRWSHEQSSLKREYNSSLQNHCR